MMFRSLLTLEMLRKPEWEILFVFEMYFTTSGHELPGFTANYGQCVAND